jgi:hypothetical protein
MYLRYLAGKFSDSTLLISRDKKAKIPTKGPAVSKSFKRVHQTELTEEQKADLIEKGMNLLRACAFLTL